MGTTAPGCWTCGSTPVGEAYPRRGVHANMISGLLDGQIFFKPDYAIGYDVMILLLSGPHAGLRLPLLSAPRAVCSAWR